MKESLENNSKDANDILRKFIQEEFFKWMYRHRSREKKFREGS